MEQVMELAKSSHGGGGGGQLLVIQQEDHPYQSCHV
jgi:hypothetical protein